jgi:uncharacterized protein YggU (UPF0235/DUF167 family)
MRDGGLLVTCYVTPRARSERIACEGGKLRVWLHAPPVEGAANEALIELYARRSSGGASASQRVSNGAFILATTLMAA